MNSVPLMKQWEFHYGLPDRFSEQPFTPVQLPHDCQIGLDTTPDAPSGPASGFYPGCAGTYQCFFEAPEEWQGERVYVRFDGVFCNATVSLNGGRLGYHPYGYAPFLIELSPGLRYGARNRLEVTVDSMAQPNCRWYAGAGIYRPVELLHGPVLHIEPRGLFLRTETLIDGDATVLAEVRVKNDTLFPVKRYVEVALSDDTGIAARSKTAVWLPAGTATTARLRIVVPRAKLWSPDSPHCYTGTATLLDNETVLDSEQTTFGIRTVTVDSLHGLRVNGTPMKLRGGCLHHVTSPLGAADYAEQTLRVLRQHKAAGYNALRCAHNPPSARFLELCDRIGLFVIDEIFDGWATPKNAYDYGSSFEDWWERDLTATVKRDRNHPSVLFWSTGNEVPERAGLGDGYAWSQRLTEKVRSLDPVRPVLHALCSLWNGLSDEDREMAAKEPCSAVQNGDGVYTSRIWAERTEAIAAPVDVVGYNYLEDHYGADHERFPDRVICGTESFPARTLEMWELVERYNHVIGDFVWTSTDYIGEAGIGCSIFEVADGIHEPLPDHNLRKYPWRTANDADWDICGFERPQFAYRRIVWGSEETFLAVQDPARFGLYERMSPWTWPEVWQSWTWPGYEGRPIRVEVYSPGDEVELVLNGRSIGRAPAGKAEKYRAVFHITYEPGVLEAVSWRDDKEISRQSLETAGRPAKLAILPETTEVRPDGLVYAVVEVQDEEGRRVPGVELPLASVVEGEAKLLAFASGQPKTTDNYTTGRFASFDGRALAILRAGEGEGTAVLQVSGPGLTPAEYQFVIGSSDKDD